MMLASDPKQSWWMTITKGQRGSSCSQKELIEEPENHRKAKLKATGDHEKPRETTRALGRQREATADHKGKFSRTDFGAVGNSSPVTTPPGSLMLCSFGE